MHTNTPQGQRMRQKDQQVTADDTKVHCWVGPVGLSHQIVSIVSMVVVSTWNVRMGSIRPDDAS